MSDCAFIPISRQDRQQSVLRRRGTTVRERSIPESMAN
jgi:hypothetical protein